MADSLKTVLGFEATQAISVLTSLDAKLAQYTAAIIAAGNATSTFNKRAIVTDGKVRNINAALGMLPGTYGKVTKSTKTTSKTTKQFENDIVGAGDATKKSGQQMILTWQSVTRIFAIQVIHQMISKIVSSLGEATEAARKYEIALAEIQTISATFSKDFEGLAAQVEKFSAAAGQPLPVVTEAVYETLSNQVADAAGAFQFLGDANQFAVAAVTSLDSSVNLLSSTINSYNMSAEDAADIGGKLFRTIDLGRIRGEEFADTFGRVAVTSAQLGISLDELLASIAHLTISGMKYNEAFTLITNVQLKLIRPTEAMKVAFKEMGIASAEAGIQAYGFQGFLEKLTDVSGDTATEIGELFGRVRAIRGALGLAAAQTEKYKDTLDEIKAADYKDLFAAKKLIFETNAKQIEIELNRASVAFTKIGRSANEAALWIIDSFGGADQMIKTIIATIGLAAVAYTAYYIGFVSVTGFMIAKCGLLSVALVNVKIASMFLFTTPLGLAITFTAALAGVVMYLNRIESASRRAREQLEITFGKERDWKARELAHELKQRQYNDAKIASNMQRFLAEHTGAYRKAAEYAAELQKMSFGSLGEQLGERTSDVNSFFDAIIDKAKEATFVIADLDKEIAGLHGQIADFKFERALKGMDEYKEAVLRMQRSETLRAKAVKLINAGDIEGAKSALQRANAQARAALSTADQSNNATLVRRAEDAVEDVLKSEVKTREILKRRTKDQAAEVEKLLPNLRSQKIELGHLVEKYKELQTEAAKVKLSPVRREAIVTELNAVAKQIQTILDGVKLHVGLADTLNLKKEFKAATEGFFDPVTGQVSTFEIAVSTSIDRIALKFEGLVDTVEGAMVKAYATILGTADPAEQSKVLAKLPEDIKKSDEATKILAKSEGEINDIMRLRVYYMGELNAALTAARKEPIEAFAGPRQIPTVEKTDLTALKVQADLLAIVNKGYDLLREGKTDTKEYSDVMRDLYAAKAAFEAGEAKKGILEGWLTPDVAPALGIVIEKLKEGAEAQDRFNEAAEAAELGEPARARLELLDGLTTKYSEAKNAIMGVNTEAGPNAATAAQTGAAANTAATSTILEDVGKQIEALRKRNALMAASAKGTVKEALGGMIYRQMGGFTPQGTDTVPAMLTPGEFVINADSTRKFFSQLVAINAGRQPVYRQEGGVVTNVGDVNITVQGTSEPKQTARETVTLMRREFRRRGSTS